MCTHADMLITDIGEAEAAIETNSSATLDAVTVAGLWTPPNRGVVSALATSGHNIIVLTNWTTFDTSEPQFALLKTKAASFYSDAVVGQRSTDMKAYRMLDPTNGEPMFALKHVEATAAQFGIDLIDAASPWLRRTRTVRAHPPTSTPTACSVGAVELNHIEQFIFSGVSSSITDAKVHAVHPTHTAHIRCLRRPAVRGLSSELQQPLVSYKGWPSMDETTDRSCMQSTAV